VASSRSAVGGAAVFQEQYNALATRARILPRQGRCAVVDSVMSSMHPTLPKGPVFIVGAPRSGTTLLQYMLRSHPGLSLPTGESHFVIALYRNATAYGDLSQPDNVRAVLRAMEAQSAEFLHTDLHGMKFDAEALTQELVAEGRRTMRDLVTALFERNAAGEGKPRWGDKTPYYVLHIPKLLEWWPDAQIIHVIRDGRDVALSMFGRRHDFRAYNTYHAARQWEQYVEAGLEHGRRLAVEQYLELRYEDMIGDQRAALQRICGFLGEVYSDDLMEYRKPRGPGKTPMLQKPVQSSNKDKWKQEMTPRQIRVFESAAGETLRKCGYALTTPATRLPLVLRAGYRWQNALASRWYRMFGPAKRAWHPPLQ